MCQCRLPLTLCCRAWCSPARQILDSKEDFLKALDHELSEIIGFFFKNVGLCSRAGQGLFVFTGRAGVFVFTGRAGVFL